MHMYGGNISFYLQIAYSLVKIGLADKQTNKQPRCFVASSVFIMVRYWFSDNPIHTYKVAGNQ